MKTVKSAWPGHGFVRNKAEPRRAAHLQQPRRFSSSVCMRPQKLSATALSYGPRRSRTKGQACVPGAFGEGPGGEPSAVAGVDDGRLQLLIPGACFDGHAQGVGGYVARCRESMAHPTTRRDQASRTTQQKTLPVLAAQQR